jgi:hypothetical protein
MSLAKVLERFVEQTPVTVMVRACMEHALPPAEPDVLFEMQAERGYTRQPLFSSVVELMSLVVTQTQPSSRR